MTQKPNAIKASKVQSDFFTTIPTNNVSNFAGSATQQLHCSFMISEQRNVRPMLWYKA